MDTSIQIEINEIAEIFLSFNKDRIGLSEVLKFLKYKDPISYKYLTGTKLRGEFIRLFPLFRNNRKNTNCFKISAKQAKINRLQSKLRLKPFKDVNINAYGIHKEYFKAI